MVTSGPRPEYPYEARRNFLTGTGIAVMEVDLATGKVTRAYMAKARGTTSWIALRWRLSSVGVSNPATVSRVKTPITFSMTGGNFTTVYDVKSKNMDDVLAHFLGKGTVLKGPIPAYPRSPAWTFKQGKGVYELNVAADGKVRQIKILKSSGDETFDREAVKTLGKWRLRPRGKDLLLELPLRFTLTPTKYSVDVGR